MNIFQGIIGEKPNLTQMTDLIRRRTLIVLLCSGLLSACTGKGDEPAIDKAPAMQHPPIQLSVKASSSTYPGFGFENALDGKADDNYVAGLEGQPANYVLLGLNPPASPTELRIVWESPQNFARRVRVSEVDKAGKVSRVIADVSGLAGPESVLPLKGGASLGELRVEFLDFSGQDRPLLRLMELK